MDFVAATQRTPTNIAEEFPFAMFLDRFCERKDA